MPPSGDYWRNSFFL